MHRLLKYIWRPSRSLSETNEDLIIHERGCYTSVEYKARRIQTDQKEQDDGCLCGDNSHISGSLSWTSLQLPTEIWHHIVERMVGSSDGATQEGRLVYGTGKISAALGLASTSKLLRIIVLEYWVRDAKLLYREDVDFLGKMGWPHASNLLRCVRRLTCVDSYLIYQAPTGAFEAFNYLEELVLDGHSDIDFCRPMGHHHMNLGSTMHTGGPGTLAEAMQTGGEANHDATNTQPEPVPLRMSYRKLKVKLPPKLRGLKIYNSHVPDIHVIHKVARECPELRSLTLARCTLFTRPKCGFWQRLPRSESDSYFSNQGVEAYATAVGKELLKIPKLQEIQIGTYLTAHEAIDRHLEHHTGSTNLGDAFETWVNPCNECAFEYQKETEHSEQVATSVLTTLISTLSKVSWLSFFSEGRVGWTTYNVRPD